jgi:hypothetical protein
MAKLTPEEFADKQARRLKAATVDIQAGIDRVTEAPGQKAAQKKDKLRNNWLAKVDDGTWEANVSSVSLSDWKDKTKNKGVPRIAAGIDAARPKVVAFAQKLLPFQDALSSKVQAMPDLSLEDNIARATEFIRGMSKFRK